MSKDIVQVGPLQRGRITIGPNLAVVALRLHKENLKSGSFLEG
jgi:hypothetical protein